MGPEGQRPIGKNTLRVLRAIYWADDALSRATFPFWKWIMARRGVEMYQMSTLGEELVLKRRLEPLFKDAAEIRIAEGDLSEGLFSERQWPPDSRIKITQVPKGEAPEEYRRFWLELEFDAYRLPSSLGAVELTSGQPAQVGTEDRYAVPLDVALEALNQRSPQAAEWFRTNLASNIDALSFGSSEVRVVRK